MKTFTPFAFALSLIAACAVFSIAQAEEKTNSKKDATAANEIRCSCCSSGDAVSPLIMALDIDKDGVISEIEIKNASSSLKALDNDGNGQLTPTEFHVETKTTSQQRKDVLKYQAGHTERMFVVKMMVKYDTNGDKYIDETEMPVALSRIVDVVDLDEDGKVSYLELFQLDDVLSK